MKRLVVMVVAAGAVLAAVAMPTKAELQKAQEMVKDVTSADVAALKAKSKTLAEVAAKHMELAGQAGNEAEKYLLLQGAFHLYVKGGDYDNAAKAIETMQAEIKDFNPEVIVELCSKALVRKMQDNAPKLYAIKENARRIVFYRKQLPIREAAVKKNPRDSQAQRKLAECHAELGNWPKALDVFVKAGGEFKKMSEGETSGKIPAQELGDFWWDYETKSDTQVYKLHAAELYRKALADDSFKGLARTRADQRVKEVEKVAVDLPRTVSNVVGVAPQKQGLYCVIDLSGGLKAKCFPISYLDDVPKGGWTDEHKKDKLVLRRVEACKFKMGWGPEVTLTKSFYIGVFEVTQRQWELIKGDRPSQFNNPKWYMMRPVDNVSYDMIRGAKEGSEWPRSNSVDADSFLGVLRAKTKLDFDLPTGAQWECACRAGGPSIHLKGKCEFLDMVARYRYNSGRDKQERVDYQCDPSSGTAIVGMYQPNAWGLYDMIGNLWELCLDWSRGRWKWETETVDPKGPKDGVCRILFGGSWEASDGCNTSFDFHDCSSDNRSGGKGFRLCLTLESEKSASVPITSAPSSTSRLASKTIDLGCERKLEMIACPAGTFTMGEKTVAGDCNEVRKHQVKITRPFWLSKVAVTRAQWTKIMYGADTGEKENGQNDFAAVNLALSRKRAFMGALNNRFKTELPEGYVFRLPTEAELAYAMTSGGHDKVTELSIGALGPSEQDKEKVIQELTAKGVKLHRAGKDSATKVGMAKPNTWGFYDVINNGHPEVLDIVAPNSRMRKMKRDDKGNYLNISYEDFETDPLCWDEGEKDAAPLHCDQTKFWGRCTLGGWGWNETFRVCLGPDLIAEKKAKPGAAVAATTVSLSDKKFSLAQGIDLEMVACPAGTFKMSNAPGGPNGDGTHEVKLTRTYWIASSCVTRAMYKVFEADYDKDEKKDGEKKPDDQVTGYARAEAFASWLNKRFQSKLPRGYVFRLPSEAEWEYAMNTGVVARHWDFEGTLDTVRAVSEKANAWKFDVSVMDYAASESDPVRVYSQNPAWVCRQNAEKRFLLRMDGQGCFRMVLGPDLIAEKKAKK